MRLWHSEASAGENLPHFDVRLASEGLKLTKPPPNHPKFKASIPLYGRGFSEDWPMPKFVRFFLKASLSNYLKPTQIFEQKLGPWKTHLGTESQEQRSNLQPASPAPSIRLVVGESVFTVDERGTSLKTVGKGRGL